MRFLLLCLLIVGCGPLVTPVKPVDPQPSQSVKREAAEGLKVYREKLAQAFETLASEIESGSIKDDEDLADRMEELTKTARLGSFGAFREAWNKWAGEDVAWNQKQRADLCREAAKGFKNE